jgi:amino acid permease
MKYSVYVKFLRLLRCHQNMLKIMVSMQKHIHRSNKMITHTLTHTHTHIYILLDTGYYELHNL